jgi:hypothetical protein
MMLRRIPAEMSRGQPKYCDLRRMSHERQNVHALRFRLPRSWCVECRLALPEVPVVGSAARTNRRTSASSARAAGAACGRRDSIVTGPAARTARSIGRSGRTRATAGSSAAASPAGLERFAGGATITGWENETRSEETERDVPRGSAD